jgi:type VI secretion system secreted protein Hcp
MAWDAYLTMEGVTGESQRDGHEGEIELISFNFGASNPSSIGIGGGGGTGTVSLSSFNITKKTDGASVEIFQHCATGEHFPTAVIKLYKSGGKAGALSYLTYEFEGVYVDNVQWSGAEGGDNIPMESVAFAFGKVVMTYTEQNPDGTAGGDHVGSWDVQKGTP